MNHELTITYRSQEFTVRAEPTDDGAGWTEAIAGLGKQVGQPGYEYRETFEWDGSDIVYATVTECLVEAVRSIIETVDDDADGTR